MPDPCPTSRARARVVARRVGAGLLALVATASSATLALPASAAAVSAPATRSAAAPADPDQPLRLTLDTLTPAVLPSRGRVTMTGSVTNTTDETWTDVRVYALSGSTPITTREALGEAAGTDPTIEVGSRTTDEGTFDTLPELAPGETLPWSIRVPRRSLEVPLGVPGVYWLGAHALGTSSAGRDGFADGRARTFVPVLGERAAGVPVSVVVPVRRPVRHRPDGSVAQVGRWVRDLGPDGSLRALLGVAAGAGDRPVTWLLDPAVLSALERLAAGNPGRSLAPTLPPEATAESPSADPSPSGSGSPSTSPEPDDLEPVDPPSPAGGSDGAGAPTDGASDDTDDTGEADDTGDDTGDGTDGAGNSGESGGDGQQDDTGDTGDTEPPTAREQEAATLARAWLDRATPQLRSGAVLALPYADLDVAAAVHRAPDLAGRARDLSTGSLAGREVDATPVAAPPSGRLDADTLAALPDDALALLAPSALPRAEGTVADVGGRRVLLVDRAATAGGPGPDAPFAAVALRQRLLAETALASLEAGRDTTSEPVVAVLPERWAPDDALGFWTGLDQAPWVRLQSVGTTAAGPAGEHQPDDLRYGAAELRDEVGTALLSAVTDTLRTGRLLEDVLTRNDQVATVVARAALGSASYAARTSPRPWRRAVTAAGADLEATLGRVQVMAPEGLVTLSSEVGGFPAGLANDLDQPVTVRIEARTTSPLTIEAPAEISLQPGERTSVVLRARTRQIGRHEVQLLVTSTEGVPLGSTDVVEIRSAQVSWIIWVVVAAGGTLLFGAIGVRLLRRLRAARTGGTGGTGGTGTGGSAAA